MKREIITSLLDWKSQAKRKPLILDGVRQCGKTFLLKEFGQQNFPACHYVDFEKERDVAKIFQLNLDPKRIIEELSFYWQKPVDCLNDLVIFDEIQACPNALTSLKYFCEEMPELALCSAGSLLGVYLNSGSYPVGKVDTLTLYPMSFVEFLEATAEEQLLSYLHKINLHSKLPEIVHERLLEKLLYYFVVGGLPEIVAYYCDAINISHTSGSKESFTLLQNVRAKQGALVKAYFADMAKHAGEVNAMHLERIWHAVVMQLAQAQDISASKFRFKDVVPGIDRYSRLVGAIDWLEKAGLIIKVNIVQQANAPLSAYAKEGVFKLLIFDVGILGAMSNLTPAAIMNYSYGTYKGFFAENFVAQEFLAAGFKQFFSWEGRSSEVEFLREIDNQILPVEVKSGNITQAKSLRVYTQKYHPAYATVMSAKNLYIDAARNVHYYPLYLAAQFPLCG